jgi:peroxiredoxin
MPLQIGDQAPQWTLLAAHDGKVGETSLTQLLEGKRALLLVTYALDFTGG